MKTPKTIDKIVCPVDFSDASKNGLEMAASLAAQHDAELIIWHMFSPKLTDEALASLGLPNEIGSHQEKAFSLLDSFVKTVKENYQIKCSHISNESSDNYTNALATFSTNENIDLIVSGTNGEDSIYELLFGSKSYRLLDKAEIPVLIVHKDHTVEELKSLVYLTDFHEADIAGYQEIASFFASPAKILYIYKDINEMNVRSWHFSNQLQFPHEAIDSIQSTSEELGVKINGYLGENNINLITISRRHYNLLNELLHNSFTKRVIAVANVPVLIIPENSTQRSD